MSVMGLTRRGAYSSVAALAVLLCLLISLNPSSARAEVVDEVDDEQVSLLHHLSGSDELDSQVYRSPSAWFVLVTASQGCPQCEALEGLVDATARSTNGLAKFAVVDALDPENAKSLVNIAQTGIPHIRLYVEPGRRNAYKKDEFYREFQLYSGQQNARAMKRFLQDALQKDAPVEILDASNFSEWAESTKEDGAVIVLSGKKEPSATVAALARIAQGSPVHIAQFSSFEANSEYAKQVNAVLGGDVSAGIPRLSASKPGESTWVTFDLSAAQKAGLPEILSFLEKEASIIFASEPNSAGSSHEAKAENAKKPKEPKVSGVVTTLDQLEKHVLNLKMPIVVAARVSGEGKSPSDWEKFRVKSHGVSTAILYCDGLSEEDASALSPICASEVDASVLVKEEETTWAFIEWDFSKKVNEERRLVSDGVHVESLSEARSKALASIPDLVMKLPDASMFQGFMGMAMQSHMLPVILLGNKPDPPAMLTSLAAAVEGMALVGYRANPTPNELQTNFGLPPNIGLPVLTGLTTEQVEGREDMRVLVSIYDRQTFGKYSYESMLYFVINTAQSTSSAAAQEGLKSWLHSHGHTVGVKVRENQDPSSDADVGASNDHSAQQKYTSSDGQPLDDMNIEMAQIASLEEWDRLCPDSGNTPQLLCAIGFLDGNPLNSDLESQQALLGSIREKLLNTPSGKSKLRFMWVDATCHQEFLRGFGMDATALPTIGVYHPRKLVFFKMFQGLSAANAEKFLLGIANGFGKAPENLESRPELNPTTDCANLPSRALPDEDDTDSSGDDDEEDWLAEIRAEEEAERKRLKQEVKQEMEQLKQAQKEAEEAAATEAAAKSKRRRRRRRKKSSSSLKDEL